MATSTEQIAAMYPWLPPEVIDVYGEAYDGGSVDPWSVVRSDPRYEVWFPGNLTDDGRPRYDEGNYAQVREGYRDVMRSMNLNPALFEDRFTELMEGEVSPDEFAQRTSAVYDRVVSASDEIKEAFASANGFDITTEGILASALDPEMGDKILLREINMAEVRGAAAESGFGGAALPLDGQIEALVDHGFTLQQARDLYQSAESMVPVLDVLAKRHEDPDDEFDLNEFTQAEVFADPAQNLRMRRLINQERSLFGGVTGFRTNQGQVTGLVAN